MLYTPQRRHVVSTVFNLVQQLYTPNILIFVARILTMVQINAAGFIHPERSLLMLSLITTLLNFTAGILHLLEYAGGGFGGKGLVLDFVGQSRIPSLLRVLSLDVLIYALQVTALTISYVNNKGNRSPTPLFPHKDPLLPSRDLEEEITDDMEAGLRRRKAATRDEDVIMDEEAWLDEQEDEVDTRDGETNTLLHSHQRRRRREPPLVLTLSLRQMLHIIYRLPADPLPGILGSNNSPETTPSPSPPRVSNARSESTAVPEQRSSEDVVFDAEENGRDGIDDEDDDGERGNRDRESEDTVRGARGELGRIPGEYWVSRG